MSRHNVSAQLNIRWRGIETGLHCGLTEYSVAGHSKVLVDHNAMAVPATRYPLCPAMGQQLRQGRGRGWVGGGLAFTVVVLATTGL